MGASFNYLGIVVRNGAVDPCWLFRPMSRETPLTRLGRSAARAPRCDGYPSLSFSEHPSQGGQ